MPDLITGQTTDGGTMALAVRNDGSLNLNSGSPFNYLENKKALYTSNFVERGLDGWQSFNQFSGSDYYGSPHLTHISQRGRGLGIATSHANGEITMIRLGQGTPAVPRGKFAAKGLKITTESSFKAQDKNFPYAIRWLMDTQIGTIRAWAAFEYRINTTGASFTFDPALTQPDGSAMVWVNTSSNDSLVMLPAATAENPLNGNIMIPPNEPGKPTKFVFEAQILFKPTSGGMKAFYDYCSINGNRVDLSHLPCLGETLNYDYNDCVNCLFQTVNRPTNYLANQYQSQANVFHNDQLTYEFI
jgi:hypothetical protein